MGGGSYKDELLKQANSSKYRAKILFLGELDQKSVMRTLAKADLFVNPSYSEGLPTSVMEAASVGLPIIARDVGGTNEIIKDYVSGIVIKPNEVGRLVYEILYLVEHREFAKQLGQEALNGVRQKYDWDKITDQYESLLKEVVG